VPADVDFSDDDDVVRVKPGANARAAVELARRDPDSAPPDERAWADAVGRALAAEHGPGAERAAEIYFAYAGRVDQEMVSLVAAVREHVTVALLSNATDQLREHLAHHRLVDAFDVVFCSAEIGIAKPDLGIYTHAATVLGVAPDECFFTDDRPENVAGARAAGMHAEVFAGRAALVASLRALGLPVA
jgi:putative hydrolase of the HAD superfamily